MVTFFYTNWYAQLNYLFSIFVVFISRDLKVMKMIKIGSLEDEILFQRVANLNFEVSESGVATYTSAPHTFYGFWICFVLLVPMIPFTQ